MRFIALLGNFGLLLFAALIIAENWGHMGREAISVIGLLTVTSLANFYCLIALKTKSGQESWLGLWLRRKKLEEKNQIHRLQSE